jgi:SAM-dependent methyltransferase
MSALWKEGREKGLAELEKRIGNISEIISSLLKDKQKLKILEFGCGYCHAILDLKKKFGDKVEIRGINKEKDYNVGLTRSYALDKGLFSEEDIDKNLPSIHIIDANNGLSFKDGEFDLIYGQHSFQYIKEKAFLLEEFNRILNNEGLAHIDIVRYFGNDWSDQINEVVEDGKTIDFLDYLRRYENLKIEKSKERPYGYLVMKKSPEFKLGLKLVSTKKLNEINKDWWGVKSRFVVKSKTF